jgi:hypothetical protein
MKRIKNFTSFIKESNIPLGDPATAGEKFAGVLQANKNVKEQPKSSNSGPEVTQYLKSVGLYAGLPWCAAFVYYIFDQTCKNLGVTNPLPKTAGVLDHWGKAPSENKIDISAAKSDISLVRPGAVFIMSRPGKGLGHTGIVVSVDPSKKTITTMEGNTNDQQSGEGDRVGINVRKIDSPVMKGFIDYFKGSRTPEFEAALSKAITGEAATLPPLGSGEEAPGDDVVGKGFGDVTAKEDPSAKMMAQAIASIQSAGVKKTGDQVENTIDKLR